MRVWVEITPADPSGFYGVEIRAGSESGEAIVTPRTMRALPTAPWVAPGGDAPLDESELEELAEAVGLVAEGEKAPKIVSKLGRHLFQSLLGEGAWKKIREAAVQSGTTEIQLALCWPAAEHRLHSPLWEAMQDGTTFLAMHDRLTVAITRVLRTGSDADGGEPATKMEPVPAPPRVLFVIGTEFRDPEIRAGIDVLGVLRGAEQGPAGIEPRVLEAPNIDVVRDVCVSFQPHIVHFVGHGDVTQAGEGRLILRGQGENDEQEYVGADPLIKALTAGAAAPRVVALTGCHTAAASGGHVDPLAAELVRRGIPIALGMAGRIADRASRLFVRRFGIAITQGEPLVNALTHGRRAGLLSRATHAEDDPAWALPSIYLDAKVDAASSVVDGENPSPGPERIREYELQLDPVLCGRQDIVCLFERLLDRRDPLNNAVVLTGKDGRLGKTRLLHEFAARSLRRGHMVVMIKDRGTDISRRPRTAPEFALQMVEAMHHARKSFGLDVDGESALIREVTRLSRIALDLTETRNPRERLGRLQQWIGLSRRKEGETSWDDLPPVLPTALEEDLGRLAADARAGHPDEFGPNHRVMVVLGGIGEWGEVTDLLCQSLFDTYGFGTREEPVPVFATGAMAHAAEVLGRGKARAESLEAIEYLELTRLEGAEELIAYQTVLLHPSKMPPEGYDPLSSYVPNFDAKWAPELKNLIKGVPENFNKSLTYAAPYLERLEIIIKADEEDIMQTYLQAQAR